ncbi:MAG: hypothetical protein Q7U66_10555 [Methylobacter sp.]|nr:hypothetical protein [Methylobacter sp.]
MIEIRAYLEGSGFQAMLKNGDTLQQGHFRQARNHLTQPTI